MKKKIPLEVLEALEPYYKRKSDNFLLVNSQDNLLSFHDIDTGSDFYFNIESFKNEQNLIFNIEWKPSSRKSVNSKKMFIKNEQLESYFTNWLTLLDGYSKVKSKYDDPILKSFEDEYFSAFELLDEDCDKLPFDSLKIILIDSHIETIEKQIDQYQTDANREQIERIKSEMNELRNSLTIKPQSWVVTTIARIWARITMLGIKPMKKIIPLKKRTHFKNSLDNNLKLS